MQEIKRNLRRALKAIAVSLIILVVANNALAQNGTLTVSSNSNQKFWLFIEDVLQNEYSTHSIRIIGLQLAPYRVRVEMDNADNNCVGKTIQISPQPNQNNYMITKDRHNNYLFGKSNIAANPFFVQNVILPDYAYFSSYQQFLYPGFNPNANYGQNQYKGNTYNGHKQHGGYGGYGHGESYGYGGNYGQGGNHGQGKPSQHICMPTPDFNRAISVIQGESFDDSKLSAAKQISSKNPLCVAQIVQICKLFKFEDSKLDFAKYAYRYCVDKNNYFQLNEVFTYSASKDELREYIDRK